MSPFDAGAAAPDAALIHEHFETLHTLAAKARVALGIDGVLYLCSFGEDPETGQGIDPRNTPFKIGNVDEMVMTALQRCQEKHRNIYAPLAILRPDIPRGKRGTASDIRAILALAVDADSDPGKAGIPELPLPPPYIIQSSAGNLQPIYPLARALPRQEALPIAVALAAVVGGDGGTGDLNHVWRVPGTLNWPNQAKAGRGRPLAPQLVEVARSWNGSKVDGRALHEAALALAAKLKVDPTKKPGGSRPGGKPGGGAGGGPRIDTGDGPTLAEVEEALTYIDPDTAGRKEWLRTLMAIHDEFGDDGLTLAVEWSRPGALFHEGEVEKMWSGFKLGGGVTISTLFKRAADAGCNLTKLRAKHRGGGEQEPGGADEQKAGEQTGSAGSAGWPEPDPRYLRDELPPAPPLPLEVFGPRWATWIKGAAEAKASPPDYVASALLSTTSSLIGCTRWASPWLGWKEPPSIWTMNIGRPSSNKSPGFDAVMTVLRRVERQLRDVAKAELSEWRAKAEVAKAAEAAWKEALRAAFREGTEAPAKPQAANPGAEPVMPRLVVTDATIEKLGMILEKQPRGVLLFRDELAGWLMNMTRYSGGSSDRPFWAEAYGGRPHGSERVTREGADVEFLLIGVTGGIQPDRLRTLLLKSSDDDDGLPARFLPFFPEPVPVKRPAPFNDDAFLEAAIKQLLGLQMVTDDTGAKRPWLVLFSDEAKDRLDAFRIRVREEVSTAEGLLESFVGKMPGMVVRLSLSIAYLDWTAGSIGAEASPIEPVEISADHFERAARFMWEYALPMARRAYFHGSLPPDEIAARKLARLIHEKGWRAFRAGDVLRLERSGIATGEELRPALLILEDAAIIAPAPGVPQPRGGRPPNKFIVNPGLWA